MMHRSALLSLALVACSDTSPSEFVELVESSRGCSATAECTVAGAGECTCATPVNVAAVADIDEAASEIECERATITCNDNANVRCEGGRCISDGSP
jgi:hypothetical protein